MAAKDLVVSADGHLLEPTDLFLTRLPKQLRDRAVWEEDFEIEPLVEGGARIFRRLHTPGFEGWTVSRYRQTSGRTPEGDPEIILEDMDADGVDAQVLGEAGLEEVDGLEEVPVGRDDEVVLVCLGLHARENIPTGRYMQCWPTAVRTAPAGKEQVP